MFTQNHHKHSDSHTTVSPSYHKPQGAPFYQTHFTVAETKALRPDTVLSHPESRQRAQSRLTIQWMNNTQRLRKEGPWVNGPGIVGEKVTRGMILQPVGMSDSAQHSLVFSVPKKDYSLTGLTPEESIIQEHTLRRGCSARFKTVLLGFLKASPLQHLTLG